MAVLGVRAGAWRRAGSGDRWITVAHHEARIPEQGWKLHVSATVPGALTTLKAVLPVLLDRPTAFKVAASLEAAPSCLPTGDCGKAARCTTAMVPSARS